MSERAPNDSVHWFIGELAARVVAASGRAADRHHLGKLILHSLAQQPDFILQMDGATGESESGGSVLARAVRCGTALRRRGLAAGHVAALLAPAHLDLLVPLYAALFTGVAVAAVDRTLALQELQSMFSVLRPKLVFCQSSQAPAVQVALNAADVDATVVTFDRGHYLLSFSDLLLEGDDIAVEDFRATDFDPAETVAFLIATSGTTGAPKAAAATHRNVALTTPYLWARYREFPGAPRLALALSPLQWLTALMTAVSAAVLRHARLASSAPATPRHATRLINTYKPSFMILSPTLAATLLREGACDWSCFDTLMLGGSAVSEHLIDDLKREAPGAEVMNVYGMSELTSIAFHPAPHRPASCGLPMGCLQYRIVDVETLQDVTEPRAPGELWLKGPGIIREYYRNEQATRESFAADGWFRTGDMFYRDHNHYYYFVDRIKLLLKYKSYQISPVELEEVIRGVAGVRDVAVTGVPDAECGDLPVACVVPRAGCHPTAQDIKDIVKETLSDAKQLRGGVIFMQELPMTASTKVHRRRLREMALTMSRE